MISTNHNKRLHYLFICFLFLLFLVLIDITLWMSINRNDSFLKDWIYIYGWIGVVIYVFILFSWKEVSGFLFSPYTLFITFVLLFNYGQFILWSLGIHYIGELGTTSFIRYMDEYTLLQIEIISSLGILSLHFGALLSSIKIKISDKTNVIIGNDDYNKAMKIVGVPLAIISGSAVIFESYQALQIGLSYGYTAIYYGVNVEINPILKYITYMFFPSLIAILIGNKFSIKSFIIVCAIFFIYMLINMLAGDRGSWVYYLPILYWCYIVYIKKITIYTIFKYTIYGIVLLSITAILVKFREVGYTAIELNDIYDLFDNSSFIFIKPFFEMGQSARVLGIVIQDNLDSSWTFGNTYISAILSMFIPRTKLIFGYPDFYLDNWISQTYLGIENYGIGFSIIAEAYLNGGLFFSWLILIIIGIFVGLLLKCNVYDVIDPKRMFIVLSSAGPLAMLARGSIELNLRKLAYGTLFLLIIIEIVKKIFIKRFK